MKKFIGLFSLLLLPIMLFSLEVKGRIFSRDSLDPIAGAVVILKQGENVVEVANAEDDGRFVIEDVAAGKYVLEIKAAGYYVEKIKIDLSRNLNRKVYISPQSTSFLGEIDVIGEKDKGIVSKNVITRKIREKAATSMTSDPVDILTKMPGVELGQAGNSSSSKLSVRGGDSGENTALMDGATVTYPYHRFFGDSIFIDEMVDEITLYKGVIPVAHGQALSSVLDVNLVDGKPGFHGKINIGLMNLFLTLNGATDNEKWNWNMGIRRTHYDLIIPLFGQAIGDDDLADFPFPYFWDSIGKVDYKPSKNDTLSLRWTWSIEPSHHTNLGTNKNITWIEDFRTAMINLKWKHIFSKQFFMENSFSAVFAGREMNFGDGEDGMAETSTENNIQYKLLTSWYPKETIGFKFGGDLIYYPTLNYTNIRYGTYSNVTTGTVETTNFSSDSFETNMGIYALFLENDLYFFKKSVHLLWGVRANYSDYIKQFSIDPRATLEFNFKDKSKVYASIGHLSQIRTDPTDLSALTDDTNKIHYPGCIHYVVGSQINFSKTLYLTADVYYKDYNNMLTKESNIATVYSMEGGDKYVVGGEILLMKKPDTIPLYGWISFSSYRAMAWRDEGFDPNSYIGAGGGLSMDDVTTFTSAGYPVPPIKEWYIESGTDYKLNINAIWDINKRWSVTLDFNWKSGSRYTPVKLGEATAVTFGSNTMYLPTYEEYNSGYMPDEHALNIKGQFNFNIGKNPASVFLQINNVYNSVPITSYNYNKDYTEMEEPTYFPVGIFPVFGFSMKW